MMSIWAAPVLPGKGEGWRRFCQELMGSRRPEYVTSRQRLGIEREASWLIETPQGAMAVVCWKGTGRPEAWQALLVSERPFDRWFRERLEHFLDLSAAQTFGREASEPLYCWEATDE